MSFLLAWHIWTSSPQTFESEPHEAFIFCSTLFSDNLDSLFDWMVGDDEASVGKSIEAYFSKIVRKGIFLDYVGWLKRP